MSTFPIVMGTRLRATRINSCGLPIAGECGYIVTDGFVRIAVSAVMKDAEELEQTNAEGRVCVSERTTPQRKYFTVEAELCSVNTELISLFNGWEQVLNHSDRPVGFRDQRDVESDFGVALEVWTGGSSEDDCPVPEGDDIFENPSSGKSHGYLLIGAKEFTLGDIEVAASVSTVTLSGISIAMPQWGKGPWNVVPVDSSGTPGRLLEPLTSKSHYHLEWTSVAPPKPTKKCCPLSITDVFKAPNYYFGGPAGAAAAEIAPDQPACNGDADDDATVEPPVEP